MLVLTRKTNERIAIGDAVEVVVLSIQGNRVRLGFEAPAAVSITRGELVHEPPPLFHEFAIELATGVG